MSASKTSTTKTTGRKSGAKKATAAKSSGRKSTKSTGTKKATGAKTTKTTTAAPVKSSSAVKTVQRFDHLADAAKRATVLMLTGAKKDSGRAPVATPNIVAVVAAMKSAKLTPAKLTGLSAAELTKLAAGAKIAKKDEEKYAAAKSAAREFSSDSFGAHSTRNKLRGAKLYAILSVIESDGLLKDKETTAAVASRNAVAVKS